MESYPLQKLNDGKDMRHSRCRKIVMMLPRLLSIILLTAMGLPCGVWGGDIDGRGAVSTIAQADSLEQAWAEAIGSAHRLKAGHSSTEAAYETVSAAKSMHFPKVTAEGGHYWLDEGPSATVNLPGLPGMSVAMDDRFWAGGVTATLPLYTSGRISAGVAAAEAGWKAARAEERRDVLDLKLNVADAYVKVLRATQAVELAASSVAGLASHSENVSALFDKDFVAKNDLLASRVVLADARQREIQARNGLDLAGAGYNRFLVRPLTQLVTLQDLTPPPSAGHRREQQLPVS